MANNSKAFILGLLALWAISQKPSGSPKFGRGGSFRSYSYNMGGYPVGYEDALEKTQGTYGVGSNARIPDVQDAIEEHRISNPAPRSRPVFRPSRTLEPMRKTALAKTQAVYGSGTTAKLPAIQDILEQRRT